MFSRVTLERRVPNDHPLPKIRQLTDEVLRSLNASLIGCMRRRGRLAPRTLSESF